MCTHQLALRIPIPILSLLPPLRRKKQYLQSARIETPIQIRYALPFDAHLRTEDIIPNRKCRRDDKDSSRVQEGGEGGSEFTSIDDDLGRGVRNNSAVAASSVPRRDTFQDSLCSGR